MQIAGFSLLVLCFLLPGNIMPSFRINGESISLEVASDTPLLWALRDHLKLNGTKFGCGGGHCGACTVYYWTTRQHVAVSYRYLQLKDDLLQLSKVWGSRRKFLIGSGLLGGGLVLGFSLRDPGPVPRTREAAFQHNAWLQITKDNKVIFQMAKAEMRRSVHMGMTTIIAEKLDYDPSRIIVELAGVHPDFVVGMGQLTGASMSTAASWGHLREAGAMAREMLITIAANRWWIDNSQCISDDRVIMNQGNKERLSYDELVDDARHLSDNVGYSLKDGVDYRWLGKPAPCNDSYVKSIGKAEFEMDVDLPNMKVAVVVRPSQFGASVQSWNADVVSELPGVVRAFEIHSGVTIAADSYWEAHKTANSMEVQWQDSPLTGLDPDKIRKEHEKALRDDEAHLVVEEGDVKSSFAEVIQLIEAEYAAPFLAHTIMESQSVVAHEDPM